MSKYKILHKRETGRETWAVYYNGSLLKWYHPDVLEGSSFCDVYYKLDNAKELIRLHKEHLVWLEEQAKLNVTEWLDEEGTPLQPKDFSIQPMYVQPIDPCTSGITAGWICAAIALVVLLMLGAIFA